MLLKRMQWTRIARVESLNSRDDSWGKHVDPIKNI